jgi:hypothetical protein
LKDKGVLERNVVSLSRRLFFFDDSISAELAADYNGFEQLKGYRKVNMKYSSSPGKKFCWREYI